MCSHSWPCFTIFIFPGKRGASVASANEKKWKLAPRFIPLGCGCHVFSFLFTPPFRSLPWNTNILLLSSLRSLLRRCLPYWFLCETYSFYFWMQTRVFEFIRTAFPLLYLSPPLWNVCLVITTCLVIFFVLLNSTTLYDKTSNLRLCKFAKILFFSTHDFHVTSPF